MVSTVSSHPKMPTMMSEGSLPNHPLPLKHQSLLRGGVSQTTQLVTASLAPPRGCPAYRVSRDMGNPQELLHQCAQLLSCATTAKATEEMKAGVLRQDSSSHIILRTGYGDALLASVLLTS